MIDIFNNRHKKRCKNCLRYVKTNRDFCSQKCSMVFLSSHLSSHNIDKILKIIAKYTGGQMPHGIFTDLTTVFDLSRERIRQKAMKLGLIAFSAVNNGKRNCVFCRKEFNSKNARYCSEKCRIKAHKQKYLITMICEVCGKQKEVSKKRPSKYCSWKCRDIMWAKKRQYPMKRIDGRLRRIYL